MNIYKIIGLATFLFILAPTASTQTVWPGDVNNNGIVNNIDYLYWGYANGLFGPPRLVGEQGIEFEAKDIDTSWGINLPGTGVDVSFADCDGNGIVEVFGEDQFAIMDNYGLTHGIVTPDNIEIGAMGVDPPLFFESDIQDQFFEGNYGGLFIQLGTLDQMVADFQGIAFTIRYDPEIISAEVTQVFFEGPWVSDFPLEMVHHDQVIGTIDVAISRFEPGPIQDTFGPIAALFFIIEDDVVSMDESEIETVFYLEKITMFDSDLNVSPVVEDSITVTIFQNPLSNNDLIEDVEIDIFPNPTNNELYIETPLFIEEVEFYNPIGQLVFRQFYQKENNIFIQLDNGFSGFYFVKIKTSKGIIVRRIMVTK